MDPAVIFVILLLVGAVIFVILFIIKLNADFRAQEEAQSGQPVDTETPAQQLQQQTGWSEPKPVPGPRGNCSLYTFPSLSPTQPAIPNYSTDFIDSLTPGSIGNVDCVDTDQAALQKVAQVCLGDSILGNVCYDNAGRQYNVGQVKQFYAVCNKTQCQDTLAPVAVNFTPQNLTTRTACLNFNPVATSRPVTGEVCDLQSFTQVLRVERQDPDGTVNNSGAFGRLFDRSSGLCIMPESPNPSPGDRLILSDCSPSNGYVWWFFPPQQVPGDLTITPIQGTSNQFRITTTPQGFNQVIDLNNIPANVRITRNDNGPSIKIDFTFDPPRITINIPPGLTIPTTVPIISTAPQQLVYFPNQGQAPPRGEDLKDFIVSKNPVAMVPEIVEVTDPSNPPDNAGDTIYGQPVTLQPMATTLAQSEYTAQTLDYWIYDQIVNTPVTCTDCGTNFIF